ncbi:MAG: Tn7-like transposition protein B [Desulfotomaculum sp. 46_296]|nr:MAG: Tn7-like transposition protein B [Desulfotomaculum sp. 46_296]KUK84900.1 MAG: Tn7-like transposition protein B [Desulfofundulus kuznetsovii]
MTAILAINTIIEWLEGSEGINRLERVLWIDAKGKKVVVFALFNPKALPEWKEIAEIEKAFADGAAIKRISDPYTALALPDSAILQKHRERRDRAWDIIKDLVVDEPGIYKSEGRGNLLHHISGQFGVQAKTVYKYLRKYWAGGKTKNALLPAYDRCGAPGKERKATEGKKRGRPPKLSRIS